MNVEEIKVIQAIQLIELHFDTLAFRNSEKVMNSLRIDSIALNLVLELIRTCRLKPITELDMEEKNDTVIPDFTIRKEGEHYEVSLCRQRSATLFVNTRMIQQLKTQNQVDKDTLYYLRNKVNSAQWFVDAIKQREHTMQKVMRVIVELQAGYFNNGDIAFLKPMILQNIADKAHVDISTISRITCNKYADTHFGVIKLKDLFSEGLETALGETISNRVIRHEIEELVKREDQTRPFTDQQIVTALSKRGFVLARRTIAKYREQSRIPAFQLRSLRLS